MTNNNQLNYFDNNIKNYQVDIINQELDDIKYNEDKTILDEKRNAIKEKILFEEKLVDKEDDYKEKRDKVITEEMTKKEILSDGNKNIIYVTKARDKNYKSNNNGNYRKKEYVFDKAPELSEQYIRPTERAPYNLEEFKKNPYYEMQTADYFHLKSIIYYPDEIWIPLYDIPDVYMISSYGRLYNIKFKNLLKILYVDYTPLYLVYYPGTTQKYKRRKSMSVAKMVLQSFNPIEDPENHNVIYKDGNKMNFHLENLKWQDKNDEYNNMKKYNSDLFKYMKENKKGRAFKYML